MRQADAAGPHAAASGYSAELEQHAVAAARIAPLDVAALLADHPQVPHSTQPSTVTSTCPLSLSS